jgi:hypothetical protein
MASLCFSDPKAKGNLLSRLKAHHLNCKFNKYISDAIIQFILSFRSKGKTKSTAQVVSKKQSQESEEDVFYEDLHKKQYDLLYLASLSSIIFH